MWFYHLNQRSQSPGTQAPSCRTDLIDDNDLFDYCKAVRVIKHTPEP